MFYILLICVFFILFVLEYNAEEKKFDNKSTYFWIGTIVFIASFAFRGKNVGGDTSEYCLYFAGKDSSTYGQLKWNDNIEIGFRLFCSFFNKIDTSAFWFIFVSSTMSILPFSVLLWKNCTCPNLAYLYIYCSNFLLMVVNLQTNIRQTLAIAYIMFAIYLFLENHTEKKYIITEITLVVLSIFTHTSMYLVVPFILLIWFIPFNKTGSIIAVLSSLFIGLYAVGLFVENFNLFMMSIMPIEELNNISRYSEGTYEVVERNSKFSEIVPYAFWAILNIYYSDKKELNTIYMKCMVVGCVFFMFSQSFPLAFRMVFAFQLMGYCYIPKLILENRNLLILNFLPLLAYFYRIMLMIASSASYHASNHLLPYKFFFE